MSWRQGASPRADAAPSCSPTIAYNPPISEYEGYAWKPTLQTGLDAERRGENGSARGCTPFRYQAARRILSRRSLSGLPGAARARSRPPDAGRIIFSQPLRPLRGGLSRSRDMELGQESGLQAEFRRQLAVRASHHQPGFQ